MDSRKVNIFNVNYTYMSVDGDLYITDPGMPFIDHLLPANWNDEKYYEKNPDKRITLLGSGNPRKIMTQPVNGKTIDIVVKYCRVGQYTDIAVSPGIDFISDEEKDNASWNGPFEEFGLVNEYRFTNNIFDKRLKTQIPLAIFSPEKKYEPWEVQRSEHHFKYHNIALKKSQEVSGVDPIELDIRRLYAMIYLWVEGEDAGIVFRRLGVENELPDLVRKIYNRDIKGRGYSIADTKPEHIIVRTENGELVRDENKDIDFALVDFELLRRTEECEKIHKRGRRVKYWGLVYHKDDDFKIPSERELVNILGVNFIYGTASNGGKLWIAGKNPELFDYFEPTKWRITPRSRLSGFTSRTFTLDNIQLAYKESRVKFHAPGEANSKIFKYGFNSPFEEVAIADGLRMAGIPVVNPRAIYRTSHQSIPAEFLEDKSRIESHARMLIDGEPILSDRHEYFILYGLWRGIDPLQDFKETGHWGVIDVEQAFETGLLSQTERDHVVEDTSERLKKAGFTIPIYSDRFVLYFEKGNLRLDKDGRYDVTICIDANRAFRRELLSRKELKDLLSDFRLKIESAGYISLNLRSDHLLLNTNPDGELQKNSDGTFHMVLCNFELIKPPWYSMCYEETRIRGKCSE